MKPSLSSGGVLQSPLANSMTNKNLKYFKVSPRERWSFTEKILERKLEESIANANKELPEDVRRKLENEREGKGWNC